MLLYHGTSEKAAKDILKRGIQPRGETGHKGNWEHSSDSRPDCVYLTSVYAPYFAGCATDDGDGRLCVVEIDVDRIDDTLLLPDEDYMEQATRKSEIPEGDEFDGLRLANAIKESQERMIARTAWFRENLELFWHMWEDSINGLGNCCLQDEIPSSAITRIAYFDIKSNPSIWMSAMDPIISLMNFSLMQPKYEALTKWFMGEYVDAGDVFGGFSAGAFTDLEGNPIKNPFFDEEKRKSAQECLAKTDGLEVVRLRQPYAVEIGEEVA